jgi:pyruvate carboxylase
VHTRYVEAFIEEHAMLSANPSVNANERAATGLIDVTLRDAHQCLWSTRMTTPMMTPILSSIDARRL